MLEGQTDLFKEYTVGHVRQEEIVGISALVEPYHLTATARVAEASRLIKIDAPTLRQLCRDDPHLGYRLMSAMAKTALERLHSTRQQLAYT
jgi:CRP-like cAMP-binding protein